MTVVTDLVPDVRREGRIAVLVDGRPLAVVSLEAIERLGLRPGVPVDDTVLAALADADAECAVYDRALSLLAHRARSTTGLRRQLVRGGAEPARAQRAVDLLAARGLLDDAEYARQLTRSRVRGRGASARRVRQELTRQGVDPDIAVAAIADVFEDETIDESTLAEHAARKRAPLLAHLAAPVQRRRLYAFLARRGYAPDDVRRAVDAALKGTT